MVIHPIPETLPEAWRAPGRRLLEFPRSPTLTRLSACSKTPQPHDARSTARPPRPRPARWLPVGAPGTPAKRLPNGPPHRPTTSAKPLGAARRAFDTRTMAEDDRRRAVAHHAPGFGELIAQACRRTGADREPRSRQASSRRRVGKSNIAPICRSYAAGLARGLEGETQNTIGANRLGLVLREPIGVVGITTPWNFPLQSLRPSVFRRRSASAARVVAEAEANSPRAPQSVSPSWRSRPVCRRVCSTWSPAMATLQGRCWPKIRGRRDPPSPARCASARSSPRSPDGASSAPALELGGRDRRSSSPTPISRPQPMASPMAFYHNGGQC